MHAGTFWHQFLTVPEAYPCGYHLLLALGMLVLGPNASVALFMNLIAAMILVISTFQIGKALLGSAIGALGAVLVASFPALAIYSREAMIEYWLTATTALAIWQVLRTEGFTRRAPSLLLGVIVGFGLLLKPTFVFATWAPLTTMAVVALTRRLRVTAFNIAGTVAIALALAAAWYVPHRSDVIGLALVNREDGVRWGHVRDIWGALGLYVELLTAHLTSGPVALLGVIGLGSVAIGSRRRTAWVLWTSFLGSWVIVLVALAYRDDKYLMPTLPALALGAATAVFWFRRRAVRVACVAGLLVLQLMVFSVAEFGWPKVRSQRLFFAGGVRLWAWPDSYYFGGFDGQGPWAIRDVVSAVDRARHGDRVEVGVVPLFEWFSANALIWEARRQGSDADFYALGDAFRAGDVSDGRLDLLDYIVLKTGTQGLPGATGQAAELSTRVRDNPERFHLEASLAIADGSDLQVYSTPHGRLADAANRQANAGGQTDQELVWTVIESPFPASATLASNHTFRLSGHPAPPGNATETVWESTPALVANVILSGRLRFADSRCRGAALAAYPIGQDELLVGTFTPQGAAEEFRVTLNDVQDKPIRLVVRAAQGAISVDYCTLFLEEVRIEPAS